MEQKKSNIIWNAPVGMDPALKDEFYAIDTIGEKVIAVGKKGVIYGSDDGKTWNPLPAKTNNDLYGVYTDGNRWIITGEKATIAVADTPPKNEAITWRVLKVNSPTIGLKNGGIIYDIAYGENFNSSQEVWLAIDYLRGAYLSRDNGETWQYIAKKARSCRCVMWVGPADTDSETVDFIIGTPGLKGYIIHITPDGWELENITFPVRGVRDFTQTGKTITGVAHNILESQDGGKNWKTTLTLPTDQTKNGPRQRNLYGIAENGGNRFAVGGDGLAMYSLSGGSWKQLGPCPSKGTLIGVRAMSTSSGVRYVACGAGIKAKDKKNYPLVYIDEKQITG